MADEIICCVSLRLQSTFLSCGEISDLVGTVPDRCFTYRQPVSSRNPEGPKHQVTTWVIAADVCTVSVDELVFGLLHRCAGLDGRPSDISGDVVIRAEGSAMGTMVEIRPETIFALTQAHLGIVFDIYNGDEEGSF